MQLKRINSAIDRVERNKINENFDILERGYGKAFQDSQLAKDQSNYAVETSDEAKVKADSVQLQIDQLVIEGDSSVEAAQARVSADATTYDTLKARLDEEYNKVTRQLAHVEPKVSGMLNLSEYPKLEGESDDSARLNRLLDNISVYEKISLNGGVLEISEPIVITKKNIGFYTNAFTTIKAIAPMESCIILDGLNNDTIGSHVFLSDIIIDANSLANHCILVKSTNGLYNSDMFFDNLNVRGALLDGILISGGAWQITLSRVTSWFNGRDGIRAVMRNTEQVNTVRLTNCFLSSNGNNGVTINGTSHVIENCTVERNKHGISFDASINDGTATTSIVLKNVVTNCYLEWNELSQIHAKSKTGGGSISALSIVGNYLLSSNNAAHTADSLIKFEGDGVLIVDIKDNYYNRQVNAIYDIDGGNILLNESTISDTVNIKNARLAAVLSKTYRKTPIPSSLISGVAYDLATQKSVNVLPLSAKSIFFSSPVEIQHKVVRGISIFIDTDCTSYTVRTTFTRRNLDTGVNVKTGVDTQTKSGSGVLNVTIANYWNFDRTAPNEFVYFSIELTASTGGNYFYYNIPSMETTR